MITEYEEALVEMKEAKTKIEDALTVIQQYAREDILSNVEDFLIESLAFLTTAIKDLEKWLKAGKVND